MNPHSMPADESGSRGAKLTGCWAWQQMTAVGCTVARTWLSIRVDLVEGHGERYWPRPGRIFAAARSHTFRQLADAIDDAFARWDRSHLQEDLRELPPIRAVLSGLSGLGLLVVDGYADLDPGGRPGLGAYAQADFGIPVIGVAKTAFRTASHAVPVLRGTSVCPLFVTAAGMPRDEAADLVRHMAGQHRLPDAIRRADTLARTSPPAELTHRPHG